MSCMAPLYVTNSKKKSSAHKSSPFRSRVVPSNEPQLINNTNSGNKRLLLTESSNNSSLTASYRELAMKYYAAFPALGSSGDDDCLITATDGRSLITATTTPTKKQFNSSNNSRKRFDTTKWNGQRIIQLMSTADGCGDGFDGCAQRQTLNESTYWPEISDNVGSKPTHQQLLNENAIKNFNSKTFDTLIAKISEELNSNNNKLSLTSISEELLSSNTKNNDSDHNNDNNNNSSLSSKEIFGVNGTKAVYCGDIEDDMIKQSTDSDNGVNSCSLVVNNNNRNIIRNSNQIISNKISNCEINLSDHVYDYGSQEGEIFQKLVEKFNSNIASIWSSNDASEESVSSSSAKSLSKSRDNIWSFDSSFSSSQSSATPSPKYIATNGIDMWSTAEVMDDKAINSMTPINMVPNLPTIPEIWESSVLQKSMKTLFESDENAADDDNWISSELFVPQSTKFEFNTTTLKNHQENSLFVEFSCAYRSLSSRENNFLKQFDHKLSINGQINGGIPEYEPDENLLTSPKTHFKPIKTDSFDRDSDEGFYCEIDSELSSTLVICSDKCPNNASFKQNASNVTKPRAISSSLPELSSFMGPFGDNELVAEDPDDSTSDSESNDALDVISNEKRDISTNTDNEAELFSNTTLQPIIEIDTIGECEPEYQDLCKMINEVLRNGLVDDFGRSANNSFNANGRNVLFDDWCTDNSDTLGDFKLKSDKEKRLSWNCYWDTYDTTNTTSVSNNSALIGVIGDSLRKDMLNLTDDKSAHHDLINDDVFVDLDCDDRYLFDGDGIDDYVDHQNLDYSHTGELFHDPNVYCHQIIQIDENSADDGYCLPNEDCSYDVGVIVDGDDDNLTTIVDDRINDGFNDYLNEWESNNDSSVAELSSLVVLSTFKFEMKSKSKNIDAHPRIRKPCTFFLEGNCKRSDCKYSHDVSAITCKYWKEGFCFKFDSCPFLHGYPA